MSKTISIILIALFALMLNLSPLTSLDRYTGTLLYRDVPIHIRDDITSTEISKLQKALDLIPQDNLDRVFFIEVVSDSQSVDGADGWATAKDKAIHIRSKVLECEQSRIDTVIAHECGHIQDYASGKKLRADDYFSKSDKASEAVAIAYAEYYTSDLTERGIKLVEKIMPKYLGGVND